MMVGYAYGHGVLHRLVLGQPLRAVHLHEPRLRPLRLGLLDDGHLQRAHRRSSSGSRRCARSSPGSSCCRSSSTSACGSSASSSSSPRCTATSCRRAGSCSRPTIWDVATHARQLRPVLHACSACSCRFLPIVATAEVKSVLPQAAAHPHAAPRDRARRAGAGGERRSRGGVALMALLAAQPAAGRALRRARRVRRRRRRSTTPARAVRDAGYTRWDAHAPFPVHGLERAMGLKASRAALDRAWCMALGGAAAGMGAPGLGERRSPTRW